MTLSPYWLTDPKPIPPLERAWVEHCLAVMALAPDTRDDYTNEPVGMAVRPCVPENHTLVCGDCRNPWHPIKPTDPDDPAWYGRCAGCNSANLIVESEPIPGPSRIIEWHLQCQMCEATWVGIPGDPCWWCERAAQRQIDHQIDLLLTAPDVDPDDINYEKRIDAWADRMVVGVEAGLITEQQAAIALRRAQMRRSA